MARAVERLSQHWASQKMSVSRGAPPQTVKQFEATHKVVLPAELRDYFLEHDGMDPNFPNDHDAKGFTFWQLARVQRASKELTETGQEGSPELDEYFAFADYLDWSWAYAIRLTADPRDSNRVVMIGTADGVPMQIASSFGEFVDLYLEDSPRLYPH